MIVVDSSVWVEYFRASGSPADLRLTYLLETRRGDVAMTEVVLGELLAGEATDGVRRMRDQLVTFRMLRLRGQLDFEFAAALYRACRERGEAVRHLTDCLIAVVAIRAGATLLHADRDFEKLARHTPLRLEPV